MIVMHGVNMGIHRGSAICFLVHGGDCLGWPVRGYEFAMEFVDLMSGLCCKKGAARRGDSAPP